MQTTGDVYFRSNKALEREMAVEDNSYIFSGTEILPMEEYVTAVKNKDVDRDEAVQLLNDLGLDVSYTFLERRNVNEWEIMDGHRSPTWEDVHGYGIMRRWVPYAEIATAAYANKIDLRTLHQEPRSRRARKVRYVIKYAAPLLASIDEDQFERVMLWLRDISGISQKEFEEILPETFGYFDEAKKKQTVGRLLLIAGSVVLGLLTWQWSKIFSVTIFALGAAVILFFLFEKD